MASRKPRRANNQRQNHGHGHGYNHTSNNSQFTSDYESDYPNYSSDAAAQQEQDPELPVPPPPRSNEDLNLAVLQRHNPSITSIVSLAPYAVIYVFSPASRQWEKSGAEGTLFVCNLTQGALGEERYNAFVLNRRGLNNFDIPLTDGENVELTEEYVILKSDVDSGLEATNNPSTTGNTTTTTNNTNSKDPTDVKIYGIWIYSEPPPNSTAQTRAINAQMIRECAVHAGQSLRIARERLEAYRQNGLHMAAEAATATAAPLQEVQSSVPMGRQVSLKDLFGQQRAQDDGWTTRAHHLNLNMGDWQQPPPQLPPVEMAAAYPQQQQPDVLGDLFRKAGLAYQGQ